jgi:hypothetical protein
LKQDFEKFNSSNSSTFKTINRIAIWRSMLMYNAQMLFASLPPPLRFKTCCKFFFGNITLLETWLLSMNPIPLMKHWWLEKFQDCIILWAKNRKKQAPYKWKVIQCEFNMIWFDEGGGFGLLPCKCNHCKDW